MDPLASAAALQRTVARLHAAPTAPWLHGEVAQRMAARLAAIRRTPQRVLQWWGWLGASGGLLRAAYADAAFARVEPPEASDAADPGWLGRLRRAAARRPAVPRWRADEVPSGWADLVWSNMGLQFAADPRAWIAGWRRALAPQGFLMFSTLGTGTLAELRALYRERGWGHAALDLPDMHDLGDDLVRAGFADPVMDQQTLTLTWPDARAALAELRQLGANLHPQRHGALRTPRWRASLDEALAARCCQGERIALSFEVVFGHAFQAEAKPAATAPRAISLDRLRDNLPGRSAP